ncbi:hypothetical protein [Pseudoalteromonas sp. T1lg23B]|nr:hypothetical protein [Pseudoalteromonas sp. T1lg23B]
MFALLVLTSSATIKATLCSSLCQAPASSSAVIGSGCHADGSSAMLMFNE